MKRKILSFFLLILFSCVFTACNTTTFKNKIIKLPSQQTIENYAKIDVTPYPFSHKNKIKFDITIESYQNEEMLTIDLFKTALLEDGNGNFYAPLKWIMIKQDKYQTKGTLIFAPIKQKTSILKLKLFQIDSDSEPFKWSLKESN